MNGLFPGASGAWWVDIANNCECMMHLGSLVPAPSRPRPSIDGIACLKFSDSVNTFGNLQRVRAAQGPPCKGMSLKPGGMRKGCHLPQQIRWRAKGEIDDLQLVRHRKLEMGKEQNSYQRKLSTVTTTSCSPSSTLRTNTKSAQFQSPPLEVVVRLVAT